MSRLLLLFLLCATTTLGAQLSFLPDATPAAHDGTPVAIDLTKIRAALERAPGEFTGLKSQATLDLPMPNGEVATFRAFNSPLIADRPEYGSYVLRGPWGSGRVSVSPYGFSAVVQGPDGFFLIEPVEGTDDQYRTVSYGDMMRGLNESQGNLSCGFAEETMPDYEELAEALLGADAGAEVVTKSGNEARELRVYDLIMTCTAEFTTRQGGVPQAIDAFNTAASVVNGIFEPELGVRMNLIIVDGLIYTDPDTDPFPIANEGGALLDDVIVAFNNNNVGPEIYDLGHLFTNRCTDVGGVVSGRACTGGKTRGVTCVGGSVVGAALRIMTHEIAHQFTVSHTWNACPGSEGQRASNTAFEPGSGSTIMSYSGACSEENIGADDSYYHVGSLEQFLFYTREGGAAGCATVVQTNNVTPEVTLDYVDGFTIPISTPFRLEGAGTDANGDELRFNWEQFDLNPAPTPIRDPRGNAPLFRSVPPTEDGNVRYFPRFDRVINNINSLTEVLPDYTRELTFRLTARDDNEEAGGVDWAEVQFFADESAGPFVVLDNPGSEAWREGDYREVQWDVANTDQAPVSCSSVNILLSTDRGQTFDVVLARNVPNNGSAFVSVPAGSNTFDAMIMVEAADNIFYNVSEQSFDIGPAQAPTFTLDLQDRFLEVCLPDVVTVDLTTAGILGFDTTIVLSVVEDSLPTGVTASFSNPNLTPGQAGTLEVDLNDVRFTGELKVYFEGVAGTRDTARRELTLFVTDNDYSDLATTAPLEGTRGVILATDFEWTVAENAETYDIQIATSPTFAPGTIFEETFGIPGTTYTPREFFASNTLYYWRIRPENVCGPGAWMDPNSFRTVNAECDNVVTEEDDAVLLPGNGPAFVRESILFVEEQGTISDINVPNVTLEYDEVSNVTLTLISPAGTRVTLYQELCFSTTSLNLGFDDDAPVPAVCPPDDQRVFIPVDALSAFNGEQTFGEWVMEVAVSETNGSTGGLDRWELEFCADVEAENPVRVTNLPTEVRPGLRQPIFKDRLNTTSASLGNGGVQYVLTALPEFGTLRLYQRDLMVGDTFLQADINGLGLRYTNTDPDATEDDFGFVVITENGGYVPIAYHQIIITADATVSDREVSELEAGLSVFPNPTTAEVNVRWTAAVNRDVDVTLFDLNGRRLSRRTVAGTALNTRLSVADLPNGVYLLRVDGAVRRIVKQ